MPPLPPEFPRPPSLSSLGRQASAGLNSDQNGRTVTRQQPPAGQRGMDPATHVTGPVIRRDDFVAQTGTRRSPASDATATTELTTGLSAGPPINLHGQTTLPELTTGPSAGPSIYLHWQTTL